MPNCRFTDAWPCKLAKKKGEGWVVADETCRLCLQAKEITKATRILETAAGLYGEVNQALRTMNTYTYRLRRAIEKLEAKAG